MVVNGDEFGCVTRGGSGFFHVENGESASIGRMNKMANNKINIY